MSFRKVRVACAVVACAATLPGRAWSEPQALGPVANDAPLSAHAGWVVWSERGADGRWHLVGMHDGLRYAFPVAARDVPFDADVGSDAQGAAVVTYSRCTRDATQPATRNPAFFGFNGLPQATDGVGCRLRVLDLSTQRERALTIPSPRGASDATPSMWHGAVAFARHLQGAAADEVMLWRAHRLTRLKHGAIPTGCPNIGGHCENEVTRGSVQQLDLGNDGAAYVWKVQSFGVVGIGIGWELRVDQLRGGRTTNYAAGYLGGACGASYPVSPTMLGQDVVFNQIDYGQDCGVGSSQLVRGVPSGRRGSVSTAPSMVWQLALDGTTAYELRGPIPPTDSQDPPCLGSSGPCELVTEPAPHPAATLKPSGEPFI